MKNRIAIAGLLFSAGLLLAMPAGAEKPNLAMLDQLESGAWEVRMRGDAAPPRSMCVSSGRAFIQLRHPGQPCSTVVIDDKAQEVTVQYTCKGQGYGRTHVRRETSRLVQIDSQGIVGGVPFSFAAEARRVGKCAG
jgi:Protein of unknown function (DUF3617).